MSFGPLQSATYRVHGVEQGPSGWSSGRLSLDMDALRASLCRLDGIADVDITLLSPGDSVRVNHVLDVVVPTVVAEEPARTFPGILGSPEQAGRGLRNTLDGMVVISTAALEMAADDGPALIDLGGPGSSLTPWSETFALVLSFSINDKVAFSAAEASIRIATLEAARDLAVITVGHPPDALTSLERQQLTGELPAVCAILQVGSEGPGRDTFLYGEPVAGIAPRVLDPLEILDGALTSGAYGQAGTRNPTAFYQRSRLLEQLMREHGRRLDFTGVVLTLGYLDDISAKEEMAAQAARLALETGADGAILTTFGGGNSHTDSMLTCQSVEALGMRTVVILAETNGGLTDHVPAADAIVSTGNEDELVSAWRPERVVGGDRLPDGRSALDAGPLSALAYVGSVCQLGDLRLTAAP